MRLLLLTCLAGLLSIAPSSFASQSKITDAQRAIMDCINAMGVTTEWGQCARMMFSACADNEVGTDAHLACLTTEHDGWREAMDGERLALVDELTTKGVTELSQVMEQWFGYVAKKCTEVALGKPKVAAEAAQTGCEISEMAGVTTEFVACRQGKSTAPYCVPRK